MSQITKNYVEQYKKNVITLAQQEGSFQRKTINTTDVVGRNAYLNAVGSVDTIPITTRHASTPILDTPNSRRMLTLRDFAWGDMIDDVDLIRMITNPRSQYVTVAQWAFGRRMDQVINSALLGTAQSGMTGETPVPLPAEQKLGTTTDRTMDLDMLLDIKEKFDNANIQQQATKTIVLAPRQLRDLLSSEEVTSADYASIKALVQGQVNQFMGFNFITTSLLDKDIDDKRHCIAYTTNALTLGIGMNPKVRIAEVASKSFNTQIYMHMSLGAVRMQDEMVVEALCWEDPTAPAARRKMRTTSDNRPQVLADDVTPTRTKRGK